MTLTINGQAEKNDPMLVLHNETGQFHVIGPSGQKELWQVMNGKVLSVTFIETLPPREGLYLIEKFANQVAEAYRTAGSTR